MIYDSANFSLYVGTGPGVRGEYIKIDLNESFVRNWPVIPASGHLPADTQMDKRDFYLYKKAIRQYRKAYKMAMSKKCPQAERVMDRITHKTHYLQLLAESALAHCNGDSLQAKVIYNSAIQLKPAYHQDYAGLQKELEQ